MILSVFYLWPSIVSLGIELMCFTLLFLGQVLLFQLFCGLGN